MLQQILLLATLVGVATGGRFNYVTSKQRVYSEGDRVGPIEVNSLHSRQGIVYLDFYSLKFCAPPKQERIKRAKKERIGEVLWGDRIEPSLYTAEMMENVACRPLPCPNGNTVEPGDLALFDKRINAGYRGNLILDNLPLMNNASYVMQGACPSRALMLDNHPRGWALGVPRACLGDTTHINNHLDLEIHANEVSPGRFSVVGFYGTPRSVAHKSASECNENFNSMDTHEPVTTNPKKTKEIIWSYSVRWVRSPVPWASRWDAYLSLALSNRSAEVHWVGIANSCLIVFILSAIGASILLRTLHIDFNRYNNPSDPTDKDEGQEEIGWKLVHRDVFRPPPHPRLFSMVIGTGIQLLGMCILVLTIALFGVLSPATRGGLLTTGILLFVLMSIVNGFCTAYTLKMLGIIEWRPIFGTAFAYPGLLLGTWMVNEFIIYLTNEGYNASPIGWNIVYLGGLWFGISIPLVVMGASFAWKIPRFEPPTKVSRTPRPIPPQRWYLRDWFVVLVPGIFPFLAGLIELRFILSSIWQGMVYYVFTFLTITAVTVIITAVEVAVVMVYLQLVFEDWRWWWRSVAVAGGMGLHFFLYSIHYFKTQLHVKTFLASLIYFEITAMISLSIYLIMGALGALGAYIFVHVIYSNIKTD